MIGEKTLKTYPQLATQIIGVLISLLLILGTFQMSQITNRLDRIEASTNGLTGTTSAIATLQSTAATNAVGIASNVATEVRLQTQIDAMFLRLAVLESRVK